MSTYYKVATIGDACSISGTDPGYADVNEVLRYQNVADTGCKIVDNPILYYVDNMCVLYNDLEDDTSPYYS